MNETSGHKPECMEPQTEWPCPQCAEISCECTCICERIDRAYGRGYRDALLDVHDAICAVVPPDERRAAISLIWAAIDALKEKP